MARNPFADPVHAADSNPFADPSVVAGQASHSKESLDLDTPAGPTLGYGGGAGRSDDTATRLEEIRRRERELEDRERNIGAREEHVRNYGRNNFPPFFPIIFHSIEDEIPAESRIVVLTLFRLWLWLVATLVVNLVACILLLVSGQPDGGKDLGAGIMYVPVITVTSFFLWYRPIYSAFMKEHALFYYIFFAETALIMLTRSVFCGFHIAFCAYMLVGIPSTGSGGLINTIHAFATGSIVTGVFGIIASVGWGLELLGILWEYRSILAHHKAKGHNFEQAKQEAAREGLSAYFFRRN